MGCTLKVRALQDKRSWFPFLYSCFRAIHRSYQGWLCKDRKYILNLEICQSCVVQKVTVPQKRHFYKHCRATKSNIPAQNTQNCLAWLFQCSDPMRFIKQLCCPSSCLPTRLLVPQVIKLAIDEYSASVEASSTVERTAKHYWYTDQQFLNCFASFLSSTSLK